MTFVHDESNEVDKKDETILEMIGSFVNEYQRKNNKYPTHEEIHKQFNYYFGILDHIKELAEERANKKLVNFWNEYCVKNGVEPNEDLVATTLIKFLSEEYKFLKGKSKDFKEKEGFK